MCSIQTRRMALIPTTWTVKNTICFAGSFSGASLVALLGGPSVALVTLMVFVVLDFTTGVAVVFYRRWMYQAKECFRWERAMAGLIRKAMYLAVVIFAVNADKFINSKEVGIPTHGSIKFAFMAVLIGIEACSILRHFGLCDIATPKWISKIFEVMRLGKGESDEKS